MRAIKTGRQKRNGTRCRNEREAGVYIGISSVNVSPVVFHVSTSKEEIKRTRVNTTWLTYGKKTRKYAVFETR